MPEDYYYSMLCISCNTQVCWKVSNITQFRSICRFNSRVQDSHFFLSLEIVGLCLLWSNPRLAKTSSSYDTLLSPLLLTQVCLSSISVFFQFLSYFLFFIYLFNYERSKGEVNCMTFHYSNVFRVSTNYNSTFFLHISKIITVS